MDFKIKINRFAKEPKQTLGMGTVYKDGVPIFDFKTLELPDKNNQKKISCILAGVYPCKKVGPTNNIPYEHFAVLNVPNRSGIKIHRANYVTQLLGCIATGKQFFDLNKDGLLDVTESTKTLNKLLEILPNEFELEIN